MSKTYSIVEEHYGKIIHVFYDEMGKKHYERCDFKPTIGFETEDETGWKSIDGKNIQPKILDSLDEYYNYQYDSSSMIGVYGMINSKYQFINNKYKNFEPNVNFIKTAIIDIEVYSEEGFPDPEYAMWPITSISIKDNKSGKFYVAAIKPYDKLKSILKNVDINKINFKYFKSEFELLEWLIKVLKFIKPDILCGWYSDNFDFPYIINRFDFLFEDEDKKKELSPIRKVTCEKMKNGRDFRSVIGGMTLFDYLRLYKKYIFKPRESYSLDFIANVELGDQKLDYSEYDNLNDLWIKNPQKYIDYNIFDVELIDRLDKKLGLINLACTIAYKAKCNFIDVMGTIKIWDVLFYNYLTDKGIMIPPMKDNDPEPYPGAYVKEPITKIYDWILAFDLNSLYPHLQQQFNISPECIVDGKRIPVNQEEVDKRFFEKKITAPEKYIMAANGCLFRKDIEGFIPKILKEIYSERIIFKNEMLKKKQLLVEVEARLEKCNTL